MWEGRGAAAGRRSAGAREQPVLKSYTKTNVAVESNLFGPSSSPSPHNGARYRMVRIQGQAGIKGRMTTNIKQEAYRQIEHRHCCHLLSTTSPIHIFGDKLLGFHVKIFFMQGVVAPHWVGKGVVPDVFLLICFFVTLVILLWSTT